MKRALTLIFVLGTLTGCVRTRTVTEYVYVPDTVRVPAYVPDTLALTIYRQHAELYDQHESFFDTRPDSSSKSFVQAANAEGAWLRSWVESVRLFFRQELQRWEMPSPPILLEAQ